MAEIIPALNQQTLSRMTAGEKRVARRLVALLEDDYLIWYDIPVGKKRRYPDFIILHPSRGLLFLEVKDWKPETIKSLNKSDVSLLTNKGLVVKPHPLEQVRQCTYTVLDMLSRDPLLCQNSERHKGNLIMPYGWGVVFTNITRNQIKKAIPDEEREILLPDHLMIYKDEITESTDAEHFQEQLWGMFNYNFGGTLTLPQIDRIRWHLFPEIRIDDTSHGDLFAADVEEAAPLDKTLPDIIKIMDIQQEQLARSLGEGHRVIHGVAGSGKTLILGYRCLHLAQATSKPILVLCYNVTLAAKLRTFISDKGIGNQVQVYHFHDWCGQQIKTYHVDLLESKEPAYIRQVETVIDAVDKGLIPRAQYGALLIDEGHDFDVAWMKLVVQMVDPEVNSLLLLYDDAQSIYQKRTGLGFSLSSVGVQAQGRTTILRLNYRNTHEILEFSYKFAKHYLSPEASDDDHIPLIEPESAGRHGPEPYVKELSDFDEEGRYIAKVLSSKHDDGMPWSDMCVVYRANWMGKKLQIIFSNNNIPVQCLDSTKSKKNLNFKDDSVKLMTMHSSKGLEFPFVTVCGVGSMPGKLEELSEAKILYVAMTRSIDKLLVTYHGKSNFTEHLNHH